MPRREDLLVPAEALRWRCDPELFGVDSTQDLDDERTLIGQPRALDALRLGIELRAPGYNVFVSGLSGTGRTTAVRSLLIGLEQKCIDVPDKVYVAGFDDPTQPRLLQLTRGRARPFAEAMDRFARDLDRDLSHLLESPGFLAQRRKLEEGVSENQRERFEALAEECRLAGLSLIQVQVGQMTRPGLGVAIEEEVFPVESLSSLVSGGKIDEKRAELLRKNAARLRDRLDEVLIDNRKALRSLRDSLEEFDRHQAREIFVAHLSELRENFPEADVDSYLRQVEEHVLGNLPVFMEGDEDTRQAFQATLAVNVLLDNSGTDDSPVLVEPNPTYTNLFGTVERRVHPSGEVTTDHTKVRAGALVRADGGYLILAAEDLLTEPGAWATLKRVLKTGELQIQPPESALGNAPMLFKPEPIPLQVKVILIGEGALYAHLQALDSDFRKTFKIRADFDSVMERSDENVRRYGGFLAKLARADDLLPFDKSAMAAVAEYGARAADDGSKISTQFSLIADVAREANHFAQADGAARVGAEHVLRSLDAAEQRENLYDRRLAERIVDGTVLIRTEGEAIGVANALTVFSSGRFSFGKPARITATASAGDHGLLNIEREVQLSGEIHDKGVLILSSYFRERFGRHLPLSFTASLCFEQNYGGVDGDSASSTELYTLFSVLADAPLSQGVGITGSVNQKGEIQPIGGINEKVEGYFDICRTRGLTGEQGVILPFQNAADLMLSEEIVEAARAGKFHVWAIRHVDEGLEILTGIPAGSAAELEELQARHRAERQEAAKAQAATPKQEKDGKKGKAGKKGPEGKPDAAQDTAPAGEPTPPELPDSLHLRVARRLLELAEVARDFKAGGSDDKDGEHEHPPHDAGHEPGPEDRDGPPSRETGGE